MACLSGTHVYNSVNVLPCQGGFMTRKTGIALAMAVCLMIGTAVYAADFKGRVIYVNGEVLEVKKKSKEMTFRLTEETVFIRDGIRTTEDELSLCQTVRVTYKGKGRKAVALKVEILEESDCMPGPVPPPNDEGMKSAPCGEVSPDEARDTTTDGTTEVEPAPAGPRP